MHKTMKVGLAPIVASGLMGYPKVARVFFFFRSRKCCFNKECIFLNVMLVVNVYAVEEWRI